MKNLILYSFILILFNSCWSRPGGGAKKFASSSYYSTAELVSKKPLDFDNKFGYKIMVRHNNDTSGATVTYVPVWIHKVIYNKLPEPTDSTIVFIHYLERVQSGKTDNSVINGSLLWDFEFKLCIEFEVKERI